MGHLLMENRNALIVETDLTQASGTAEREAALTMIDRHRPGSKRITLGADKAFDVGKSFAPPESAMGPPLLASDVPAPKPGKPGKPPLTGPTTPHPAHLIVRSSAN